MVLLKPKLSNSVIPHSNNILPKNIKMVKKKRNLRSSNILWGFLKLGNVASPKMEMLCHCTKSSGNTGVFGVIKKDLQREAVAHTEGAGKQTRLAQGHSSAAGHMADY